MVDFLFGMFLENLEFGVDCDFRIAFVGLNGVGKLIIFKFMMGDIEVSEGEVV